VFRIRENVIKLLWIKNRPLCPNFGKKDSKNIRLENKRECLKTTIPQNSDHCVQYSGIKIRENVIKLL
jgi:hypothetical protein